MDSKPFAAHPSQPSESRGDSRIKKIYLYAPNVNSGGGLVLLNDLLSAHPSLEVVAFLDKRASTTLSTRGLKKVYWVSHSLLSRVCAEILLSIIGKSGDYIFCFHGLPPLLPNRGVISVFLQNIHYFGNTSLRSFSLRVALRIKFERCISDLFRYRVSKYIVQTQSMKLLLLDWYKKGAGRFLSQPTIEIWPFKGNSNRAYKDSAAAYYDFVYIADGAGHKNHVRLVEAWIELSRSDIKPSLCLTLGPRDHELVRYIDFYTKKYKLNIINIGYLEHSQALSLYQSAGALIFPSLAESFGLPLIEASNAGLNIIASELDYVRDICNPTFTFDPNSAISISRAVKRFMGVEFTHPTIFTPSEFWKKLIGLG